MKHELEEEVEIKRYLLGELTLEEQVLIEKQLFLDSRYAQLAQAVEDDLIDDYVHDELTTGEREKFESHFLKQPNHDQDIRIAQALDRYIAFETIAPAVTDQSNKFISIESPVHKDQQVIPLQRPLKRKPIVWLAIAAAILIVISIVTWIAFQSARRSVNEPPLQTQAPQPVPTGPPIQQPGPSVPVNDNNNRVETANRRSPDGSKRTGPEAKRPPLIATIFPGGSARGEGQTNKVRISSEQQTVILRLPVKKDFDKYRFVLLSGETTVESRILNSGVEEGLGPVVFFEIPAKRLSRRTYTIRLSPITTDGTNAEPIPYAFTVERRR